MSYESAKNSILTLENFGTVSIEQMLGLIVRVVEDTYKNSSVRDISEMKLGNPEETMIRAYSISTMLLKAMDKNKELIEECDQELWEECQKISTKLETVHKQLEEKSSRAKKLQEQKELLKSKEQSFQRAEQNIVKTEQECIELQRKISQWNDSGLNAMIRKQNQLSCEFENIRKKRKEIEEEIAQSRNKIAAEGAKLQAKEEERIKSEHFLKDIGKRKKELEETASKLEEKKEEYNRWVTEFEKMNPDLQKRADEYETTFRELYTAVNSIMNDEFLMANLYQVPDAGQDLTQEDYPDLPAVRTKIHSIKELRIWLDGMQKRINGLLHIYQAELISLVECSEKLTGSI